MLDHKIIRVAIGRSFGDVYGFLADGRNFSAWGGSDPGAAVEPLDDGDWQTRLDGRKLVVRCSERNIYGILDYRSAWDGSEFGAVTPVRVYANLEGSEFVFTYFRRPGFSDGRFVSGADWIESDLLGLKSYLEKDWRERRMLKSSIVSLSIERPVASVYRFLADPQNYPKWASLTGHRFERRGERDWFADTAAGPRIIRFAERNGYGVLDHAFFAEGETPITNPMRVVTNGQDTLLTYTGFQRPGMSDEKFASTMEWINADLLAAKSLLEI